MSGGYFDRSTYAMREIADTMERDITAKAREGAYGLLGNL